MDWRMDCSKEATIHNTSALLKNKQRPAQMRKATVAMGLTPSLFASGCNDDGLIMELHPKVKDVDNMEKFVSVALHGVVCNNVNVISQKA
jgi:hypothetical protein